MVVEAVWCELVSSAGSLIFRENTGNCLVSGWAIASPSLCDAAKLERSAEVP